MIASDLRIGNLVNEGIVHWIAYDNGVPACGILKSRYSSMSRTINLENIKPIPLTEEWWPKLGYECIQEFVTDLIDKSIIPIDDDFNRLVNAIGSMPIHQLQNLYFALSGEEL
jgi:hypothetical protein